MSTMPPQDAAGVNAQNPWPGLSAFSEELSGFFFGRAAEAAALLRLLNRGTLTVLFGQSGLGKTSLLHAGLAPGLRRTDFLPVYLRLDHGPQAPPLRQQVYDALAAARAEQQVEGPPPGDDEALWEYFHRRETDFWSARNRLVTPVLVLDQFEEFFTLGRLTAAAADRGRAFLAELADLVENRPPQALRARLDAGSGDEAAAFDFQQRACKVLISLREDFLPDLEDLQPLMGSLRDNRLRIAPLSGTAACEAVECPAPELLEPGVSQAIVRFVAAAGPRSAGDAVAGGRPLAELAVEPSLLSLVCRELNDKRRQQGLPRITATLLEGNQSEIVSDFYRRSMHDAGDPLQRFVEQRLLTRSGYRVSVALETALGEPGVSRQGLDRLVDRRLLRLEERMGVRCVELMHDVLCEPIRASRDRRQQADDLARAVESEKAVRRQLVRARWRLAALGIGAVLAVGAMAAVASHWKRLSAQADQRRQEAEQARYGADMRLAQQAVHDLDLGRAAALLDRYRTPDPGDDYRGFEWRYLWRRCAGDSLATYHGFADQVWSVAFSPDGKTIAAGSLDSSVRVFDADSRRQVSRFDLEGPGVMCVAFSPDGRTLACGTGNWQRSARAGKLYLCDWRAGRVIGTFAGHADAVNCLAFSRDGRYLATGGEDDSVMVWKVAGPAGLTQMARLSGHHFGVNALAFTPDSQSLAAGSGDGRLQAWDVKTRAVLLEAAAQASGIMSLAFTPDGKTLLAGVRDGPIALWDVPHWQAAGQLDSGQGQVNGIALSADGKEFATAGSDATIALWNLSDRRLLARLCGHRGRVLSVAFSPRGGLASGGDDHTLKLWDPAHRQDVPTLHYEGPVESLAFSPDGRTLAVAGGPAATQQKNRIWLWDVGTPYPPRLLTGHDGIIHAVAYAPDGRTLASGSQDGSVALWDVSAGQCKLRLAGAAGPAVMAVRFSPDGMLLATGGFDGKISLWNVDPGSSSLGPARKPEPKVPLPPRERDGVRGSEETPCLSDTPVAVLSGHEGPVRAIAFSPDGSLLATASSDRTARVWQVATRASLEVLAGYKGACTSVGFAPDGRLLAVSSVDRTMGLYDVPANQAAFKKVATLPGYKSALTSLAFSPDGKTLAAAGRDASVTLWSVATRQEVATFAAHHGGVTCLAFSPDGTILATGSNDQTVKLWYAPQQPDASVSAAQPGWTEP